MGGGAKRDIFQHLLRGRMKELLCKGARCTKRCFRSKCPCLPENKRDKRTVRVRVDLRLDRVNTAEASLSREKSECEASMKDTRLRVDSH